MGEGIDYSLFSFAPVTILWTLQGGPDPTDYPSSDELPEPPEDAEEWHRSHFPALEDTEDAEADIYSYSYL